MLVLWIRKEFPDENLRAYKFITEERKIEYYVLCESH